MRFIPTRVGNTKTSDFVKPFNRGSSPRVWGIQVNLVWNYCNERFIPTRVGNTFESLWCLFFESVHPHACGEYLFAPFGNPVQDGSSPRVWGILVSAGIAYNQARFIPTRVGNTNRGKTVLSRPSVHPHACGEYGILTSEVLHDLGSSPRVWGIP